MAQLTHKMRTVTCPDSESAVVVDLHGSVDPATIDTFDQIFDELIEGGHLRIIMDLGKLKYINSTGMGMMVQYYDQLSEEGGGLVLMGVQPKIMLVLEMLGLQELFPIVGSEEEALKCVQGDQVTPANVQVRLEDEDGGAEEESLGVIIAPQPTTVTVSCGFCNAELLAAGAGTYRCPACSSLLTIGDGGDAKTYPPASDSFEVSMAPDDDYFLGVGTILTLAGQKAGLDGEDSKKAAAAVKACLRVLRKEALGERADKERINLFAKADEKGLTVHIHCGGKNLPDDSLFTKYRTVVDALTYTGSERGNLVTVTKGK